MWFAGSLYLTAAAAIWGGMYVASKYVLDYIPPFTLLVIRLAIAALILGPLLIARREWRVRPQHRLLMAVLGVVGFTFSLGFQFWGTKLSTAHNGGLITSASPAFIMLFAVWLLRERLTWQRVTALLLASTGVLAVIGPESGSHSSPTLWVGNLCLVGAAITWALYTVMGKLASANYSSLTVTAYATLSGLLFSLPVAYLTEWRGWTWPTTLPGSVWWGIAYVGVISTAVAFYFWNKGFTMMDASSASLFFFAQPLVAAVLGALLLGEILHGYFFVGAFLIASGLAVSAVGSRSLPVGS